LVDQEPIVSKLSELLKSQMPAAKPAKAANPGDPHKNYSNISNISSGDIENSTLSAGAAVSLSPVQEAARADVLSQLERNPSVQRAFVNRFDPDGTMIVTLAVRGVGTGELKIPAARLNQASLNDYAALLGRIEGAAA
jgi:hypothetical protein